MLAPPAPGRRPEKLRFDLSLLFTPSGVEYSAAEVRARSMGLLGKKWGPPAASELRDSSAGLVRVKFNDDGSRSTQNMGATASGARRKSVTIAATGEPTVTINTKEALADVFGMYNSPDKTVKRTMPGSKHAPVRKIEPMNSRRIEPLGSRKIEPALPSSENENAKPAGALECALKEWGLIILVKPSNHLSMKTLDGKRGPLPHRKYVLALSSISPLSFVITPFVWLIPFTLRSSNLLWKSRDIPQSCLPLKVVELFRLKNQLLHRTPNLLLYFPLTRNLPHQTPRNQPFSNQLQRNLKTSPFSPSPLRLCPRKNRLCAPRISS